MIKLGNEEVEGRYITDDNGVPHEVIAAYVGNNLVYNAKIEEENAEFYKRKTGGTQSVGSGIAAIKEVRGKSIVWNQVFKRNIEVPFDIDNTNGSSASYAHIGGYSNCPRFETLTLNHKYYINVHPTFDEGSDVFDKFYTSNNQYIPLNIGSRIWVCNYKTGGDLRVSALPVGKHIYGKMTCVLVDLTLMFGAGKEPATVAEFEKMFPLDYYDYNAGEVIPFAGQNLVTTGKNQYNPATGKANLLGGQTYQLLGTYTSAEIDGVAVTLDSNNCFTTTKDCVLDVVGGNNTDTIVALYNGENVSFEPYEKHTLPLDPSQWRDKQGNLVFPYGGMHGVGTAYDYAKVDADGYIRKAVRCFGQVNLGTLTYRKMSNKNIWYAELPTAKGSVGDYGKGKAVNTKYPTVFNINVSTEDKTFALGAYYTGGSNIYIHDETFSTGSSLAESLQDIMLYYELATPAEVELATPVYAKYLVDKDGTEEITPANGTTPYTTMANLHLVYRKK